MMHTKFFPLLIMAAATIAAPARAAQPEAVDPEIYTVEVSVDETARKLNVDIQLRPERLHIGRDSEQVFTSMVISSAGTDTLMLDTIRICGRNRWYWHVRNGELDNTDRGPKVFRAGQKANAVMHSEVAFEPWMGDAQVELRRQSATCCRPAQPMPGTDPRGMTEIARIYTGRPDLICKDYVFAPPVDATPVEKNLEGSAFVSFVVNRTELKPDYMINRSEIAKIINSIDAVRNDSDAIITNIHIKGFASPEGSYQNNIRLASGRTQTLTDYVRDYSRRFFQIHDTTFTNSFEPEDWAGLRRYLVDSLQFDIPNRAEIIKIVDTPMADLDAKNDLIRKTYPQDYEVILRDIYPWLRHSDYKIHYRIKVYTELKELMRLYESDPTRLRPVDFFTIAKQYPEGSPEYNKVMITAAATYPNDPMLNLNAANVAMMDNDLQLARKYLLRAGTSPEAEFARGVLNAREGRLADALAFFEIARKAGIEKANGYIDNINAIRNFNAVTITAKTTKTDEK
ncbi:MAG: hypothetical protein K2N10_05900 [Muribaculaceae bacterium]|nr:hypothetical protein [Muribaculaceae bacterium]